MSPEGKLSGGTNTKFRFHYSALREDMLLVRTVFLQGSFSPGDIRSDPC